MMMLAMIVLMSAGPMLGSVADDKQQRVFEMLLGSASPVRADGGQGASRGRAYHDELDLLISGATLVLQALAMIGLAPFHLLPWFFLYLVADVMVMCSLAVAMGSACSSPNDAQHLALVVIGPESIPLFFLCR